MEWITLNSLRIYQEWLSSPWVDKEMKEELRAISDQPEEIEDRFYQQLAFGTGGVRGVLGAGTNRMNRYTIRRVTQGLANYMATIGEAAKERGVVIAYDARHQSQEFAFEAALTLKMNKIKVYLFTSFCSTPLLSFAVRELKTAAGIVITASHNPPAYNGYKVYGEDGAQILPTLAHQMMKEMNQVATILPLSVTPFRAQEHVAGITWIGKELDDKYISRLQEVCRRPESTSPLKIMYTPLHGIGNELVRRTLRQFGFTQVDTVPAQAQPDPQFSTVSSPNPEERAAFTMAIRLGASQKADLIIATDPDVDRVGVVVRDRAGEYTFLTGNQMGVLLLHYLLSEHAKQGSLPADAVVVKTIVTGQMGKAIAAKYGVKMIETHTGFKYIGEQIRLLEEAGEETFLFGYEESCGYLAGTFVRDKDGIMATLLICEMAAYYQTFHLTLCDVLEQLYQTYGYFSEALESRTCKGKEGIERIRTIMKGWRTSRCQQIGSHAVLQVCDFEKQESYHLLSGMRSPLHLPKANVLRFTLDDGSWFCLRPSGTEPKIKVYFSVQGKTQSDAGQRLQQLIQEVMGRIDGEDGL
jgi:phosphoglucomutase